MFVSLRAINQNPWRNSKKKICPVLTDRSVVSAFNARRQMRVGAEELQREKKKPQSTFAGRNETREVVRQEGSGGKTGEREREGKHYRGVLARKGKSLMRLKK